MLPQTTLRTGFYNVNDVMALLDVSKSKAYQVMQDLNNELEKKGYHKPKAGLVSKKYFHEKFYCDFDPGVLEQQGGMTDAAKAV